MMDFATGHAWIGAKTKRLLVGTSDASAFIVDGTVIEWWPKGALSSSCLMQKSSFLIHNLSFIMQNSSFLIQNPSF